MGIWEELKAGISDTASTDMTRWWWRRINANLSGTGSLCPASQLCGSPFLWRRQAFISELGPKIEQISLISVRSPPDEGRSHIMTAAGEISYTVTLARRFRMRDQKPTGTANRVDF